jgi:hypothetical protein
MSGPRSGTVTLPTEEMRAAMRGAELGDDSREGTRVTAQ